MPKIININGSKIKIGNDDGKVITAPIASLTFSNPKVGDQVEIFKDGSDLIINKTKSASGATISKIKISKKMAMIGGGALAAVVLIVCGICFLPGILDEDLRTQSTYPEYYKNLKEEKEAFAKALDACNKAAEAKLQSKGITTEYDWDDLDTISKVVKKNDDGVAVITLSNVKPTGGDKEYNSYGSSYERDYDCAVNVGGTSVQDIYITWGDKDK